MKRQRNVQLYALLFQMALEITLFGLWSFPRHSQYIRPEQRKHKNNLQTKVGFSSILREIRSPQLRQSGQFGSWQACRNTDSPSPETKFIKVIIDGGSGKLKLIKNNLHFTPSFTCSVRTYRDYIVWEKKSQRTNLYLTKRAPIKPNTGRYTISNIGRSDVGYIGWKAKLNANDS